MFSELSLITTAYATEGAQQGAGGGGGNAILTLLIYLVPMALIFYFLAIRPQKKRDKQLKNMRDTLNIGDEIVTIGGIVGRVIRIKEDRVTIATADSRMVFLKSAIGSVTKSVTEGLEEGEEPAPVIIKKKKKKEALPEETASVEETAAEEKTEEASAEETKE